MLRDGVVEGEEEAEEEEEDGERQVRTRAVAL